MDKTARGWIIFAVFVLIYVLLIIFPGGMKSALSTLFPGDREHIYPRAPLSLLVGEHLLLVGISSLAAIFIGMGLGIAVTRPWGRDFLRTVNDISALGQTIPPVAVLALAIPFLGFGAQPTIVALILYSTLPILRNTIEGLESIPPEVTEAARGMGMRRHKVLALVELPMAVPVIIAGIRTSVVINVGTATLGASVGAGGLGVPIVSGLVRENPSFVLQGAIGAAFLALLLDRLLALLENTLAYRK
ncbi:MAG: ABC transporter permease [Spirochaetia bacterium]